MNDPALAPEHSDARGTDSERASPRADLHDATGWIAFGIAVLAGSLLMDRLQAQNINPVTVPGLLPGLLGIAMILLGGVMGVRSRRRAPLAEAAPAPTALQREQRRRVGIAVVLCLVYGVVLVGHGIPFWLASSVYITASILVFRRISPDPAERSLDVRAWL